jgi:hypothetical protein
MLYRLSYASKLRDRAFSGANLPADPFPMTGTILKVTITANYVQYLRSAPNPAIPPGFGLSRSYGGAAGPSLGKPDQAKCYDKRFLCVGNVNSLY